MSRRAKQAVHEAKRKRQRARAPRAWLEALPYVAVSVVAVGGIAALVLISVGGGSDSAQASYPPGYTPPLLGDPNAPVEMVMWGDFQCPFCRRFELNTLQELKRDYFDTGKAKFVWRNFVNYGPESADAANAAYCAGEQGKFWEYHTALYENQGGINSGAFTAGNLERFASELSLDLVQFRACTASQRHAPVLAADKRTGRGEGVSGTPTFFINGEMVVGAQPTETFVSFLENALAESRP